MVLDKSDKGTIVQLVWLELGVYQEIDFSHFKMYVINMYYDLDGPRCLKCN